MESCKMWPKYAVYWNLGEDRDSGLEKIGTVAYGVKLPAFFLVHPVVQM
jgi:hypothetical protein